MDDHIFTPRAELTGPTTPGLAASLDHLKTDGDAGGWMKAFDAPLSEYTETASNSELPPGRTSTRSAGTNGTSRRMRRKGTRARLRPCSVSLPLLPFYAMDAMIEGWEAWGGGEVGRWGGGEVGRWSGRELCGWGGVERWGGGVVGRWGGGEMGRRSGVQVGGQAGD